MTKNQFFQMMEFNYFRRILKTCFQKFFKENKTFFLEQSSLDRDSHLEEFYRSSIRVIRVIRGQKKN